VSQIHFLIKGKASFVLPKYENTRYININVGDHFGVIDIVGSCQTNSIFLDDWGNNKNFLQRQFTVMAIEETEVLNLSAIDLIRMKIEFIE